MTKRALLLGGTGAMGVYLAPVLVARGYHVDITSRSDKKSAEKAIRYIQGNAHDDVFLSTVLTDGKYDAVVDFMAYTTDGFRRRLDVLLGNTNHYLYLSSYRVFAETDIITEDSPRLLEESKDAVFLASDEYSLEKARQEDVLKESSYKNWTIIRPGITYSKERFQLGTLEADTVVWRGLQGKKVILPTEMLDIQTTLTWAGDVAVMIAGVLLNKKAYTESYNVASNESHSWRDVAALYTEVLGLRVVETSLDEYIRAAGNEYQVRYDRLFNRRIDASKIMQVSGLKEFTPLKDGLVRELEMFIQNPHFSVIDYAKQARIDKVTGEVFNIQNIPSEYKREYIKNRFPEAVKVMKLPKKIINKIRRKARVRTRVKDASVAIRQTIKDAHYKAVVRSNEMTLRRIERRLDGVVVTLIDYNNYGNIIQRYALQEFLRKHKYNFASLEHKLPIASDTSDPKLKGIKNFVDRYIVRRPFDKTDTYDTYIVGSDQVWRNWNYDNVDDKLGFFFLDFVKSRQPRRIAYAASFGKHTAQDAGLSPEFIKKITPHLKKFDAISIREQSGAQIMKDEWDISVKEVIDPTLLLEKKDYDKVIRQSFEEEETPDKVFSYVIDQVETNLQFVRRSADELGVPAVIINPYGNDELPSMASWLRSIRDSKLLVTDSFHGTVFAIINNTPFVVLENKHGGTARIETLMDILGIQGRIVGTEAKETLKVQSIEPIDWASVNAKVATLRLDSAAWLLDSLK